MFMVYCGTSANKTFVLTPVGSRWWMQIQWQTVGTNTYTNAHREYLCVKRNSHYHGLRHPGLSASKCWDWLQTHANAGACARTTRKTGAATLSKQQHFSDVKWRTSTLHHMWLDMFQCQIKLSNRHIYIYIYACICIYIYIYTCYTILLDDACYILFLGY